MSQKPVLLDKVIKTRDLTIDFQLPAILCYSTSDVISILSKDGLVKKVNHMLTVQPRIIKPQMLELSSWKLVDISGKVLDLKNWDAMKHIGTTIMVTFDQDYSDGEYKVQPWTLYRFENIPNPRDGNSPITTNTILEVPESHRLIKTGYYRRSNSGKSWMHEKTKMFLVPHSLKLHQLSAALVKSSNVQLRYYKSDADGTSEVVVIGGSKNVSDLGIDVVMKLDLLIS